MATQVNAAYPLASLYVGKQTFLSREIAKKERSYFNLFYFKVIWTHRSPKRPCTSAFRPPDKLCRFACAATKLLSSRWATLMSTSINLLTLSALSTP